MKDLALKSVHVEPSQDLKRCCKAVVRAAGQKVIRGSQTLEGVEELALASAGCNEDKLQVRLIVTDICRDDPLPQVLLNLRQKRLVAL